MNKRKLRLLWIKNKDSLIAVLIVMACLVVAGVALSNDLNNNIIP